MKKLYITFVIVIITLLYPFENVYALNTPSNEIYSQEWGLRAVEAEKAWSMGVYGNNIIIAVVDTGVDHSIGDLSENVISGFNAITGKIGDTNDLNGHGTQVSSIIAGTGHGIGIMGIAPKSKIMPIKAFDEFGNGEVQNIVLGIRWAADNGANIINLSFGSIDFDISLKEAIIYAQSKGCLIIAATGNHQEGQSSDILFPASLPGVIAVGAMNKDYESASFSNYGENLSLIAPGTEIIADNSSNSFSSFVIRDGTSKATPFVSGVAALIWSVYPDWSAKQVSRIMLQSAQRIQHISRTDQCGYGLPNAYRAIKSLYQQIFLSSGVFEYSGCAVQEKISGATLKISPLTWNDSSVVSLQSIDPPASLPSGFIHCSEVIQVSWTTLESPRKIISLKIPSSSSTKADKFLFRWTGSRWVSVASGTQEGTDGVGIFEQGVYCYGQRTEEISLELKGNDLIARAIDVANLNYPTGVDTVIITRVENYMDFLVSVPLAYKYSAPILLTNSNAIDPRVREEIRHLAPKTIYIIGGKNAISERIQSDLDNITQVFRLDGLDRYTTSAKVASTLGTFGEAIVVSGANYPDLLSVACFAAQQGKPILLVENDNIPYEIENALDSLWVTDTLIVGGSKVISDNIEKKLPCPLRITGSDRFDTNFLLSKFLKNEGNSKFVAFDKDFPKILPDITIVANNNSFLCLIDEMSTKYKDAIIIGR